MTVAEYCLNYIMKCDWTTLGPKVAGKLHLDVGDKMLYLNNAVHLTEIRPCRSAAHGAEGRLRQPRHDNLGPETFVWEVVRI
jgi:hypothetical protein